MNKILLSRNSDNWETPKALYNLYNDLGFLDPCPLNSKEDNLKSRDFFGKNLFINPPYSQIDKWVDFAINNFANDNMIVLLIPARTDTKYFKKLYEFKCEFIFITGRLHFNDLKSAAPFPSLLVFLNNKYNTIELIERRKGW